MTQKTPVLLLTGYLGSGKTTLLNRILSNSKGIKFAVIVNDINASGSCVVILKKATTTAQVVKTYYSVAYVTKTGSGKYAVNIATPKNVDPKDVIATGVDIRPMSTYSDFTSYVAQKNDGTISQPCGETGCSVAYNTAATLQAHALTSKNFSVSANSGCTKTQCAVTISYNVSNLSGVTPTNEVTLVNGTKKSGLYYLPVKFVVTYKYEK